MNSEGWGLQRWANHFNQMLNLANPPNRYRFDVGRLAMETTAQMFPGDPIVKVEEEDLEGFAGALVPAESRTRWGIAYGKGQSPGRRRFTIAHEFGHFLLHRKKYPNGIHSSEADVDGRTKIEVEREANEFASWLLMPLDDFRKQIAPRDKPDFDAIGNCATRYEVSLVAAVLRWLRYTERRAVLATRPSRAATSSAQAGALWSFQPDPPSRSSSSRRKSGAASITLPECGSINASKSIRSGARSTTPPTRCSIWQMRSQNRGLKERPLRTRTNDS
jgi:hypothetical protein